jgi:hypothetical protein
MGALAEAARPLLKPNGCAAYVALDEKVTDEEDQAAVDALAAKKQWKALSSVLGTTPRMTQRHFDGECSCG